MQIFLCKESRVRRGSKSEVAAGRSRGACGASLKINAAAAGASCEWRRSTATACLFDPACEPLPGLEAGASARKPR